MFSTLHESCSILDVCKSDEMQMKAELRSLAEQNVAVQKWSREEVLYLLELYKEHQDDLAVWCIRKD